MIRLALAATRSVLRVLAWGSVALGVLAAGAYFHLRSSMPQYAGSQHVAGLAAPVEIVRDANAVPHIYAATLEDALFGLGYAHAQDRMWQMEIMRRAAQGRLAEVIPVQLAGRGVVDSDRLMRTLGVYERARDSFAALSPAMQKRVEAYAAGVNAWMAVRRGSFGPEFTLLMHAPEPWSPIDSVVWGKLMQLSLDGNWQAELLRVRLLLKVGEERMRDLFTGLGDARDATLANLTEAGRALPLDALQALADGSPIRKAMASNEWVVGGAHTYSGKPLLANDPHLGFSAPSVWYLARLVGPDFDIRGATSPGSPAVILGHNGRIAWGFTTTNLDSQDLFVEKIDPTDPNRYVTPEGARPFAVREETIRVRFGDPVRLRIRETRHGPVISDAVDARRAPVEAGHVLALQAVALQRGDTSAEGFFELGFARDWQGFLAAARKIWGPMQNIVFADVDGNIGFVSPAQVPVRRKGDGFLPSPGWSGEWDWAGFAAFDDLPRAFNPASQLISNANARVAADGQGPFISRDWAEPYRQRRAASLLKSVDRHTPASMVAIQVDNFSPDTADLLPFLLESDPRSPQASKALALLRRWNRRMTVDSPEALIYVAWTRELHRLLYGDELGDELQNQMNFGAVGPLLEILRNKPQWCDDIKTPRQEGCAEVVAAALESAVDSLAKRYGASMDDWRWGAAHQAVHRHQVLDAFPLLGRLATVRFPSDGGAHTLNRASPTSRDPRMPFASGHGATYRAVYDLSELEDSRFGVPLGQSGHFLSPWYDNFVEDWRALRYVRISGTRFALQRTGIGSLSLIPARAPAK